MSDRSTKRESGFSLLEMTVSIALGSIVLGAAVQLYTQGVSATWTVSQRAELQQDFRAASNMLTKDLSLAGAGLKASSAIALPSGVTPVYGCDQTPKCYITATYPKQGATPYLYGLVPGYNIGPILNTPPGATDVVTVAYTDSSFYLNCYTATVGPAPGFVTFAPALTPLDKNGNLPVFPPGGCLPNGVAAPQNVNDPSLGLTPGDLVYFPSLNGTTVVAEVTPGGITTGLNAVGTTYTVPFAVGDPLHMNQLTSTGLNNVALGASGTLPARLLVITYYIDNTVSPARLMRQVSGHTPMPVVDGIVYVKFSYDLFNDATGLPATDQPNPGSGDANDTASNGMLPNQITKINIKHMAMDSALKGSRGYQGLDLETSVSARNLTFVNNYPNQP